MLFDVYMFWIHVFTPRPIELNTGALKQFFELFYQTIVYILPIILINAWFAVS